MGATKRLAEMYVQALQARHPAGLPPASPSASSAGGTRMAMVRFGNVLGSACSVLPIWTNQIAEGGPVTVTDPRMTRYFMTIHEAAMLVIQAGALEASDDPARAGVYVLDMGEPVRILELASRFVAAHGFAPRLLDKRASDQRDAHPAALPETPAAADDRPAMDIALVGARPGEKTHEELAYAAENLRPTAAPGINAWAGALPASFDATSMVSELSLVRHAPERDAVLAAIRRWVPEMRRPDTAHSAPPATTPAPPAPVTVATDAPANSAANPARWAAA
jgi:FlaA1/EpsC-like NDP-sugar epimerase